MCTASSSEGRTRVVATYLAATPLSWSLPPCLALICLCAGIYVVRVDRDIVEDCMAWGVTRQIYD